MIAPEQERKKIGPEAEVFVKVVEGCGSFRRVMEKES